MASDGQPCCCFRGYWRGYKPMGYRLARATAGDGMAAVSLNGPCGWDYAAGHALVRGAGGVLIDESGHEVTYTVDGSSYTGFCFGGAPRAVRILVTRDWPGVRDGLPMEPRTVIGWPRRASEGALDRAVGCLLGQIAGDSLGSLVEFRTPDDIARQYPDGVSDLADGGTWKTIAGQPTDDSELALDLARTLAGRKTWSSEAVGWFASRPFDIGSTTAQALSAATSARSKKAEAAQAAPDRASQSNGALMRCAPIGIWARDAAEAAAAARADAALSHPHPVCQAASAAFVAAITTAVGGGDRDAMLKAAETAIPEPEADAVRTCLARARLGQGPREFVHQQGWVLIAFQNAFRHLAIGTPIEDALGDPRYRRNVTGCAITNSFVRSVPKTSRLLGIEKLYSDLSSEGITRLADFRLHKTDVRTQSTNSCMRTVEMTGGERPPANEFRVSDQYCSFDSKAEYAERK
jgi:ADP-ribosyl-[dinitrogen reductase] hydrolase